MLSKDTSKEIPNPFRNRDSKAVWKEILSGEIVPIDKKALLAKLAEVRKLKEQFKPKQ